MTKNSFFHCLIKPVTPNSWHLFQCSTFVPLKQTLSSSIWCHLRCRNGSALKKTSFICIMVFTDISELHLMEFYDGFTNSAPLISHASCWDMFLMCAHLFWRFLVEMHRSVSRLSDFEPIRLHVYMWARACPQRWRHSRARTHSRIQTRAG